MTAATSWKQHAASLAEQLAERDQRLRLALSVLAHRPLTPDTAVLLERVLLGLDLDSLTEMEARG